MPGVTYSRSGDCVAQSSSHGCAGNSSTENSSTVNASTVNVFEFDDARKYLLAVLHTKRARNRGLSMRAWSRQLGYKNPSYLASVLKGARTLKPSLAARVSKTLPFDEHSRRYFEALVLRAVAKTDSESKLCEELLRAAARGRKAERMRLDQFRLIASWYHLAILEMFSLSDFQPDPEWIARRLGGGLSPKTVRAAIHRLLRLGLLQKDANGNLKRAEVEPHFGDSVPSAAIRAHHLQMIEKAKQALTETQLELRDIRGSAFVFSKSQLGRAREIIQKFHQEMRALEGPASDNEVYRINTQFFPITKGQS
jgi:uncharacterized protein (TIGR02147 family)